MSFLSEAEVASLTIRQSVFHIVGPGDEHFQLLEAFDAGSYSGFFLDRVRSVHSGNRYEFLPDSPGTGSTCPYRPKRYETFSKRARSSPLRLMRRMAVVRRSVRF